MPPRLNILHDTVDSMVQKLPAHCQALVRSPGDITATRDLVRLLRTKMAVGTFGSQDRDDTRAAVMLDYVVRSRSNNDGIGGGGGGATSSFQLKDLAKSVGVKESTFKKLHATMGHYYHDLCRKKEPKRAAGQGPNNFNSKKRKEISSGSNVNPTTTKQLQTNPPTATTTTRRQQPSTSSTSSRRRMPESILPSLAIRLAGHLADPHGVARRARVLFHDIYAHALASLPSAVDRRGQEYDFHRYWSAYQASVLYHVATSAAQESHSNHRTTAHGGAADDETAVRPLKLEDLVKACPDFTYMELKEKIPCVTKWADEIREKQQQRRTTTSSSSSSTVFLLKKRKTGASSSTTNNEKEEQQEESDRLLEASSDFDFEKWKETIVTETLERTRANLSKDNGQGVDDNDNMGAAATCLDRSVLLAEAGKAILAKYGLLCETTSS